MKIFKYLLVSLLILIAQKTLAQDPYGCVVYYNGANRLFTSYTYTDGNSSRHYSNIASSVNHKIRYGSTDPSCGIIIDYNTPYGGGCTVDGITSGGLARRITVDTCPIDDYIPVFLILIAGIGYYQINKSNRKTWINLL
ncbi:MAG: hypothetical protein EOO43_11555 [Flavobacterium sp.]|nr:MAG: hypothetical protein EOO43_11555 [Flavobacterium sp.]